MRKVSGVRFFLAKGVACVNPFRKAVRRGVYQGLDLREGRKRGAMASIDVVSTVRAEENHWSSWSGEEVSGGGGTCHSLSLLVRAGQSVSCQHGLGLSFWGDGGCREISMGGWSEPVEGRVDASHELKAGNIFGLAKAISMALASAKIIFCARGASCVWST